MSDQSKSEKKRRLFTGPHQFTMEKWISCAPFEELLHMKIVDASEGKATLTMPFLLDFAQGGGLMHGGALTSLADTAVVMAIKSIVPPKTHFATVALKIEFFRPVTQGIVTAKARIATREGRTLQGEATLYDESEETVLRCITTFRIATDAQIEGIVFKDHR
jgi:uncharacterized protein (TIGR00369 family)